jgi:hypothetical protein
MGMTVAEALTRTLNSNSAYPYVPRNSRNMLEEEYLFESVISVHGTSTSTNTCTVVEVSECHKQYLCQVPDPVHRFDLLFASEFEEGQDTARHIGNGEPSTSMVTSIAPMGWCTITFDNLEFGISEGNSNFQGICGICRVPPDLNHALQNRFRRHSRCTYILPSQ